MPLSVGIATSRGAPMCPPMLPKVTARIAVDKASTLLRKLRFEPDHVTELAKEPLGHTKS